MRWCLFLNFKEVQELTNPSIQFSDFSNRFGGGNYNVTVAGEYRFHRIQESIATNPQFTFVAPRYFTAYAESTFPFFFFVDGRVANRQLNLTVARGFFQNNSMPDGFFRSNISVGLDELSGPMGTVFNAHPVQPGTNKGGVNNFVFDPTSASFTTDSCLLYTNFVNQTVRSLYPNPTGALRDALNINLNNFHLSFSRCPQLFPFGKWCHSSWMISPFTLQLLENIINFTHYHSPF